jgi:hypothetical protein
LAAEGAIMPLHFHPFWLSSSKENIAQALTLNVVQKVGAGQYRLTRLK